MLLLLVATKYDEASVANRQGLQGIQRIPWNTQIKQTKNRFSYIINQSINVYLYSPISQMLHLSQWTSQFLQNISMTIHQ